MRYKLLVTILVRSGGVAATTNELNFGSLRERQTARDAIVNAYRNVQGVAALFVEYESDNTLE